MSNELYDRLKWISMVFIPAFEVFILTLGKIWSLPYYAEIGATIAAVGLFIAACLKRSSDDYYALGEDYEDDIPELIDIDIDGDIDEVEIDE